ncbi:hypothetical protein [Alteromonas sp. PRIM-21]|uniref:hypothetical protein n=1 Tax=Alteromonas sp. PRIM-21 TaxID=1454978 RepID=UPI0022B94386|nr:hypothetical protein [Alteromonas sp. PRIM-21]MCZ8530392.1 hypothetical protein [Alteromonas sp. PRIM-21]
MAKVSEVKKIAKDKFKPTIEEYGFKFFGNGLTAYRKKNDIYQFITLNVWNAGNRLRSSIGCWVPEMQPDYDMNQFPKSLLPSCSGGGLTDEGVSHGTPVSDSQDISKVELVEEALEQQLKLIESFALPFFEEISSRELLAKYDEKWFKDSFESMLEHEGSKHFNTYEEFQSAILGRT